jgi:hypothetical protein
MQSTGLSGWARPDAGFAAGRGGGSSQLGLPLVSGDSSRTGDRIGADPRIHTYKRNGVTGQQYPSVSVDGPAFRPDSSMTALPIVQRKITATDYSSIHEKQRFWHKDSTGAFVMMEKGAPRQPPISARIVDQFASAREPGTVRGPSGHVLQERAASCEPVMSTRPQTTETQEQQRRLGEWAAKPGLDPWPHEPTQLTIAAAPTNASPRRSPSPYGRVSTLRPKPRKQLPSLLEAQADREARRQFKQDVSKQLSAFRHASPRKPEVWETRRDQVVAQITARAQEPFSALGRDEQQTLSTAGRLAEPRGALFNLDAERAVVLARGIGALDAQHGCGGQLPRCVRRVWSGHGTSALHENRFADLEINASCRRLVRHLLTAVEHAHPGRASGEHMPLAGPNRVASRAAVRSRRSSSRRAVASRGTVRPQTQGSLLRGQDQAMQRYPPHQIPMQHYPLAPHPRPPPQDWWGDEDEQELRELAATNDDERAQTSSSSRSPSPTHFDFDSRSSSPIHQHGTSPVPVTPSALEQISGGRYTTSPVFETPSDAGGALSPGRESQLGSSGGGPAGFEAVLTGGGKFPNGIPKGFQKPSASASAAAAAGPNLASMLADERQARVRAETRATEGIAAAKEKMLAMEEEVAALRSELNSQQRQQA